MRGCRPLTEPEFGATVPLLNLRDRLLLVLGCKSGFRISELLSLNLGDVFQNGAPVDRVTVRRCNMKGRRSGRTVLMHPLAKPILLDYILVRFGSCEPSLVAPHAPLFLSEKGGKLGRVQAWRILKAAFDKQKLGGKVATHSMRKHFADGIYTRLKKDIIRTQKALGHANINSTVSYLSFREEDIDRAILDL